jgi:hypothetical protein
MKLRKNRQGMTSEVFRLSLAIIVVAAILSLFAVFLSDVQESGETSINATTSALETFSKKIENRTGDF